MKDKNYRIKIIHSSLVSNSFITGAQNSWEKQINIKINHRLTLLVYCVFHCAHLHMNLHIRDSTNVAYWVVRERIRAMLSILYCLFLETARQVTHWTKWRAPETVWAISPRVDEPKCLYGKNLSRLTGLPYLPRRDDSPTRDFSPPWDEFAFSCKQLVEFFKEISEKLARPG